MPLFLEEASHGALDLEWSDAKDLLEQILLPGTASHLIYRHEWRTGDVVLWDNRCTLHSATALVPGPQLMYQAFLRTKTLMGRL